MSKLRKKLLLSFFKKDSYRPNLLTCKICGAEITLPSEDDYHYLEKHLIKHRLEKLLKGGDTNGKSRN